MENWFPVTRTDLLHTLETVRSGLSHEGVQDQSNSFAFKGGRVYTFNGELFCSAMSGLPPEYTAAILSKPLFELLKKSVDQEIQINLDDPNAFSVKLNDTEEAGINKEAAITLAIQKVEKPKTWKPLPKNFIEAMTQVSGCSGKPSAEHLFVSCVHIHPDWVECFDNRQGCRYDIKTGVTQPFLIRAENNNRLLQYELSHYCETNAWLHFRNSWGLQIAKRKFVHQRFPDISPFLQLRGTKVALPKLLIEAADKAEIFSAADKDHNVVLVNLMQNKVKIESQGVNGWYRKTKKVEYTGPPLTFTISPKMLTAVIEQYDHCEVSKNCLIVKGDHWKYITSIGSKSEPKERS